MKVVGDVERKDVVSAIVLAKAHALSHQDIISAAGHVALPLMGKTPGMARHGLHATHARVNVNVAGWVQGRKDFLHLGFVKCLVIGYTLAQQSLVEKGAFRFE